MVGKGIGMIEKDKSEKINISAGIYRKNQLSLME